MVVCPKLSAYDYIRFLNVLRRQTQPDVDAQGRTFQSRCHVYAYCLMGNHVHLLLKEESETIGDIMKRIASSYVYYYNSNTTEWDICFRSGSRASL